MLGEFHIEHLVSQGQVLAESGVRAADQLLALP